MSFIMWFLSNRLAEAISYRNLGTENLVWQKISGLFQPMEYSEIRNYRIKVNVTTAVCTIGIYI
ncbi:hypothetical protein GGR06_003501 [Bacteroides reticulotermitis]|uniref:Uncharacterized protein n=1 Tax=Bacteroides reticulotermitis TaxID=1133319 RepID=A0A840DBC5_9BACE|nr:hypothetical protein [Bacteroides reticulotermitis]